MSLVHVEQLRDIAEVEFLTLSSRRSFLILMNCGLFWPMAALWTCGSR